MSEHKDKLKEEHSDIADSRAFNNFPKLPIELRLRIFHFTFQNHNIEIDVHKHADHIQYSNPVALQINQHSRNECLRFFSAVSVEHADFRSNRLFFYISPAITKIVLGSSVKPPMEDWKPEISVQTLLNYLAETFPQKLTIIIDDILPWNDPLKSNINSLYDHLL